MEGLECEVEWSSREALRSTKRRGRRMIGGSGRDKVVERAVMYRLGRGGDALKSQGGRHGRALEVRTERWPGE